VNVSDWKPVGGGWVYRSTRSPSLFSREDAPRAEYLNLVDEALRKAGQSAGLSRPGYFLLRRGPFVVAHAASRALSIPGPLVDVFDPEFPVLKSVSLEPGSSGLYRDVKAIVQPVSGGTSLPRVLHTTHRLMEESPSEGGLRAVIRGPAETPAVVRVFTAGKRPASMAARDASGKPLPVDAKSDGATIRIRFPNDPAGVTLEVRWEG
jgi:hypothetical protein